MSKISTKEDGRPGFYFFINDWLAAGDLAICSLAAQGLWIRLLCYMWISPKRGYLLQSNMAKMDNKTIAKLCGQPEGIIIPLLEELKINRVYEETEAGIYCRRMVKEQEVSQMRRDAGLKGMGKRWGKNYNKPITKVYNKSITGTGTGREVVVSLSSKVLSTTQLVVEYYKIVKGFDKIENWDKIYFPRFLKDAGRILKIIPFYPSALKAIEKVGKYLDSKELDWNLSTIVRYIPEYLAEGEK